MPRGPDYITDPVAYLDFSNHALQDAPRPVINGRVVPDGRSRRRPDGSYSAYDLSTTAPYESLTLVTERQEIHRLVKVDPESDALDGWQWTTELGAVAVAVSLLILEPNPKAGGTSILTPGVVMREGLEVGAFSSIQQRLGQRTTLHKLGVVASVLYSADIPLRTLAK